MLFLIVDKEWIKIKLKKKLLWFVLPSSTDSKGPKDQRPVTIIFLIDIPKILLLPSSATSTSKIIDLTGLVFFTS